MEVPSSLTLESLIGSRFVYARLAVLLQYDAVPFLACERTDGSPLSVNIGPQVCFLSLLFAC